MFHGGSSLRKFSNKIKKFPKFQKCPKSFPKVSKHVLNMFWGKLFGKFLPSFPWNVESTKIFKKNIFKVPKMPKSVPKRNQTCFRVIFSKKINAQCSMEGRVFENFQIKSKNFQNSKNAQNRSQKYANMFCTCFGANFSKIFCPVFHGRSSLQKFSKKIFSKFQKCPKVFPKVSKRVLNMFWVKFFEKFFCPVFRGGSSFRKFSKKIFSKLQKCPKVFPKVSKRVLNMFCGNFPEKFCPVFHGMSSLRIFSKKSKNFQNSKNAQNRSQKYANMF